jgi:folate-binding protein YgfZ
MPSGVVAELGQRGVVSVSGADARHFLQNLVTSDLDPVAGERGGYGALLTPQGKILFDFIIYPSGEGFLLDLAGDQVTALLGRLKLYRLRAKVDLADLSETHRVFALWGGERPAGAPIVADPRLAELGYRAIVSGGPLASDLTTVPAEAYHHHRIALGVPEGGVDFAFGEAFPHDANLDQLGGVAFDKGCYVGQEIVSRMEHRGTARRRIVKVAGAEPLPIRGTEVLAGERPIGTMGSSSGAIGLALLRLDRTKEAMDAGQAISAGGVALTVSLPAYARFTWPTTVAAE